LGNLLRGELLCGEGFAIRTPLAACPATLPVASLVAYGDRASRDA